MFPSQPFPQQFTPTSNPFVQQSFGASKDNYKWKQEFRRTDFGSRLLAVESEGGGGL
jgi:hypothetical protein